MSSKELLDKAKQAYYNVQHKEYTKRSFIAGYLIGYAEQLRQPPVSVKSEQLICLDCVDGRDEFEPDWKCPDCRQKNDANNMLEAGLSLVQAKEAAMIKGKKIRHSFFMEDEYIYYKSGCWFTQDGYQIPDSYWLNTQEQGWDDSWSIVS